MRRYYLFTLLFSMILNLSVSFAQSGKTIIRILDLNYKPLIGTKVKISETSQEFVTDKDGKIYLDLVEAKVYGLELHYEGQDYLDKFRYEGPKQYSIYIGTKVNQIEQIDVIGSRKFAEKYTESIGKMPQTNLETSQTYNIIPQELLKERSVTDIKGALMAAPGVANVTTGLGSGGMTVMARMRGFTSGSASLRNGYRTSQTTMADLASVEAIEVMKGPAGTLYGTSSEISYGGIINIVTKKPKPYTFGEASFTHGAYDLSRLTLDFNTPINTSKTALFRINTAFQRSRTFQDYGVDNVTFFAPAFKFLVNDRLTLNIEAEYSKNERNLIAIGTLPKGVSHMKDFNWDVKKSFASNDLLVKSDVLNVMTSADYKISDKWTSQTIFSSANTTNKADYLFVIPLNKDTVGRRIMRIPSNFVSTSIQQNFVGIQSGEKWTNKVLIGIDYNDDKYLTARKMLNYYDKVNRFEKASVINLSKVDNLFATAAESAINIQRRTFGMYVSDVFSLNNRVHLNAGLRMDRYSDIESDFQETYYSPKFGAVYEVIDDQISLFGNFTNGFTNGYIVPQTVQFNGGTIKPQEAYQYEFGLKYELFQKKLHGNASYYNINVSNVPFTAVGADGKSTTVQNGERLSKGFEFDLTANPVKGLHIILGYGYNDSKFTKGDSTTLGKIPEGSPNNVANFWSSYSLQSGALQGFGVGVGGNYSSDFWGDNFNTFQLSGYFLLDASLFYERQGFRVSIKGNNLGDKHYLTSNSIWIYAQPTRTILGSVSYRF